MSFYRSDLRRTTNDFEALWIEIDIEPHHNTICGVVYGHTHSNIQTFLDNTNTTVDNREDKYCTGSLLLTSNSGPFMTLQNAFMNLFFFTLTIVVVC